MGRSRVNKFQSAIRHLKSNQIDEKFKSLSEAAPTNSISGLYIVEPETIVQDSLGLTRELDFTQDDSGTDTTGLFDDNGVILTIEPPGDTSYVLGPMSSMWYAWGNFTQIGYIRESDRRMVNLGRITGELSAWDGSSNFTSYGQLTLEQAVWFRDTPKQENYRAFYPGPPSSTPDEYGRYYCTITGTPKSPPPRRVPPVRGGPEDVGYPWPRDPRNPADFGDKPTPHDPFGDLILLGISAALAKALIATLGLANAVAVARSASALRRFLEWWNRGRNTRFPDEKTAKWRDLFKDDWAQRGRTADPNVNPNAGWDPVWSFTRGLGTGPTPFNRQLVERPFRQIMKLFQSYEMEGQVISEEVDEMPSELMDLLDKAIIEMGGDIGKISKLADFLEKFAKENGGSVKESVKESKEVLTESRKRIVRDVKKPYKLPETPNQKYTIKPKVIGSNRVINSDLMRKAEVPSSFVKPEERLWGKYEKKKNTRNSQEKKNELLDHLGASEHAWEWLTETSKNKNNEIMYGNFGGKNKQSKPKVVRREEVKGDALLFIADENGRKEQILQSELSIKIANEFEKELFDAYFQEQETMQYDNDPLFKKVAGRLKKEIDYPDKPSKAGYPNDPPPEMVNGWHPEYGKDRGYYNKLDPQSAEAMPSTGNAEIDAKVQKAKRIKKILGKRG